MYGGWCQVAFSAEIGTEPVPARIGRTALMLARHADGVRAYDAICPHRGAHLAYGGRLEGDVVVCPFHGHRIRLGVRDGSPLCVRAHRTLDVGGAVYVIQDERHDNGFQALMDRLAETHWLIPGFRLESSIPPEYVIENVFDADHFVTVHGVNARPDLGWRAGEDGELTVEGTLRTDPGVEWHGRAGSDGEVQLRFCAHVFSPTLVATELGPADLAKIVITAATPVSPGRSTISVIVAMPRADPAGPPTVGTIGSVLAGSRTAFEQDIAIWEHLDTSAPNTFLRGDAPVLAFREFCLRFGPAVA